MSKSEYHLLYVLSEPPIPVAQQKLHGWSIGDVLSTPQNPAISSSDRFLVLDVNKDGRVMALKIPEMSANLDPAAKYTVELKELGVSESILDSGTRSSLIFPNLSLASYCVRLDKVYFEPMITGKDHGPEDVTVVGSLSPSSMSPIIQQVLSPKTWLASRITQKHCQTNVVSDRA